MTIISDDQNFFPSIIFLKLEVHTQNLMIWLSNENDIQLWWLTQFLKYTVNTFFFALGRVVFFQRVILPTYFPCLYSFNLDWLWRNCNNFTLKDQNFASVLAQKSHQILCYWILIPHYNWMSGIWKSDSSQKNKGKALTGWKIAEFACFFVSDLLLFTACKPQLSIEWQVSKVANIFWHIVTAEAIVLLLILCFLSPCFL